MSEPHRHDGQLGAFVDGYRTWLLERGYRRSTVTRSLIALGHLGCWMEEREGIDVEQLDDIAVRNSSRPRFASRAGCRSRVWRRSSSTFG
jgi:hypothetical protein